MLGSSQPKIRVGTDDFKTLLLNSDIFVDKSLMIKDVLEDSGEVILIARPRRWGKSLNMDMLRRFFEIEVDQKGVPLPESDKTNRKLFIGGKADLKLATGRKKLLQKLHIAQHPDIISEYQGQFPVIYINFKDVKENSYQEIEDCIKRRVIKLFDSHRYLKHYIKEDVDLLDNVQKKMLSRYFTEELSKQDLKDSLNFLSELLFKHFNQKVYILIDEYDTPINSSYIRFGDRSKEFSQVLELFRGIFGSSLKSNIYLERGVMTGIFRVAKANLFSDLNNVSEYTLLDKKFNKFYGFTQAEVDELLAKVPIKTSPQEIPSWYNGYTFGGEVVYNPWSIMQCLSREGEFDNYWIDSGGADIIDSVFVSDEIQEDLAKLLSGEGIVKKLYKQISFNEISDNQNIFYSLLLFTGYLNPRLANNNKEDPRYCLTIPNKEIRNIYIERVIRWLTKKLSIQMGEYDNFISLLVDSQIDLFGERLQKYLLRSASYHDLTVERDYHNLIGGLLAPLASRYIIESNRETGRGRCDHILIPIVGLGDNALIVEYKIAKLSSGLERMAKMGLNQIVDKQYDTKIQEYQHIKKITKVSIAFCGKEVALQYLIDEIHPSRT